MDLRIRRAPTHPFQMVFLMALSSLFVNSTPVFSHPWQASNQIERDVLQQHLESQRYLESMPFEVSSGDGEEKCVEVEQCQLCYSGEEGCAITGRRRKFECTNPSGAKREVFHSCRRTVAEEEWLVFKLQIVCILLGILSMRSTRSRKIASANLFDQRRIGNNQKRSMNDSNSTETNDEKVDETETLLAKSKDENV